MVTKPLSMTAPVLKASNGSFSRSALFANRTIGILTVPLLVAHMSISFFQFLTASTGGYWFLDIEWTRIINLLLRNSAILTKVIKYIHKLMRICTSKEMRILPCIHTNKYTLSISIRSNTYRTFCLRHHVSIK